MHVVQTTDSSNAIKQLDWEGITGRVKQLLELQDERVKQLLELQDERVKHLLELQDQRSEHLLRAIDAKLVAMDRKITTSDNPSKSRVVFTQ
eukprot:SAG31_NODE_1218_length_9303_cov_4.349087_6_plen_92_part_00